MASKMVALPEPSDDGDHHEWFLAVAEAGLEAAGVPALLARAEKAEGIVHDMGTQRLRTFWQLSAENEALQEEHATSRRRAGVSVEEIRAISEGDGHISPTTHAETVCQRCKRDAADPKSAAYSLGKGPYCGASPLREGEPG